MVRNLDVKNNFKKFEKILKNFFRCSSFGGSKTEEGSFGKSGC